MIALQLPSTRIFAPRKTPYVAAFLLTLVLTACVASVLAAGNGVAGHIETARGAVEILRTGDGSGAASEIILEAEKDMEVQVGDRIRTGRRSVVVVTLEDGTRFHLSSDSEMIVNELVFNHDPTADSVSAGVVKGVFRFLSGEVAAQRAEAMKVDVGKLGTIGVRGTHVGGEVEETSARIVLLSPPESKPTAIEVSNTFGKVVIDEPGWGTEIPDEHSPPSLPRRMRLRGVENTMRAIQGASRMRLH